MTDNLTDNFGVSQPQKMTVQDLIGRLWSYFEKGAATIGKGLGVMRGIAVGYLLRFASPAICLADWISCANMIADAAIAA